MGFVVENPKELLACISSCETVLPMGFLDRREDGVYISAYDGTAATVCRLPGFQLAEPISIPLAAYQRLLKATKGQSSRILEIGGSASVMTFFSPGLDKQVTIPHLTTLDIHLERKNLDRTLEILPQNSITVDIDFFLEQCESLIFKDEGKDTQKVRLELSDDTFILKDMESYRGHSVVTYRPTRKQDIIIPEMSRMPPASPGQAPFHAGAMTTINLKKIKDCLAYMKMISPTMTIRIQEDYPARFDVARDGWSITLLIAPFARVD